MGCQPCGPCIRLRAHGQRQGPSPVGRGEGSDRRDGPSVEGLERLRRSECGRLGTPATFRVWKAGSATGAPSVEGDLSPSPCMEPQAPPPNKGPGRRLRTRGGRFRTLLPSEQCRPDRGLANPINSQALSLTKGSARGEGARATVQRAAIRRMCPTGPLRQSIVPRAPAMPPTSKQP